MLKKILSFFLLVFLFFLSSCSGRSPKTTTFDSIDISKYFAVAYIADVETEKSINASGNIIFMKKDGTYDAVSIKAFKDASIVWSEKGIFYSDVEKEYFLPFVGKNKSVTLKKDASRADRLSLFYRDMYITAFNKGVEGDSYGYEILAYNENIMKTFTVAYYLRSVLVECDNKVVAIGKKLNSDTDELLSFDVEKGSALPLHVTPQKVKGLPEEANLVSDIYSTCVHNRYYVSLATPDSDVEGQEVSDASSVLGMDIWDMKQGERTFIRLKNEDDIYVSDFLSGAIYSVDDMHINWVCGDGTLARTNIHTGATSFRGDKIEEIVADSPIRYMWFRSYVARGLIYSFVFDYQGKDDPYMRVVDERTGKEVERITMKDLKNYFISGNFPSDFALNPLWNG